MRMISKKGNEAHRIQNRYLDDDSSFQYISDRELLLYLEWVIFIGDNIMIKRIETEMHLRSEK